MNGNSSFPGNGYKNWVQRRLEMSSLKKRGKVWYIKFTRTKNGNTQEVTRSLNTRRKEIAEDLQNDLDKKINQGKEDPFHPAFEITRDKKKSWYSAQECINDFVESRSHLAPDTIKNHTIMLNNWMKKMKIQETPIQFVSKDKHVKPFFTRDSIKPQSMKSELRRFRTFWNWLLEQERVETNETKPIKLPEPDVQYYPKMITEDEFQIMIKAFLKRQKERRKEKSFREWMDQKWFVPAVTTIFRTGIRLSEAGRKKSNPKSGLKGESLIWNGNDIHFIYISRSKTNRERLVPVSIELNKILKAYFKHRGRPGSNEFVFLSGRNQPVSSRNIYDQFKIYCEIAGISEKRTIHGMRHARITGWLEDGFTMKEASILAGHKTSDTTDRIYSHLAGNKLREKMLQVEKKRIKP